MPNNRTASDVDHTDFLAGYRLESPLVQPPTAPRGCPVMRYARDPHGERTLIRSWSRDIRGDLIPFWQQEIRQLRRLEGLAAAEGLFAPIRAAGFDGSGFHLASALDERRLLVDLTGSSSDPTASSEARALRWRNLLRIAQALELLHSQGMVHRNLGPASILSAGAGEPDFRLIGHEWSIRLVSDSSPGTEAYGQELNHATLAEYFFVRDWRAFGELAAGFAAGEPATSALEPSDSSAARIRVETQLLRHLRTSMRIDASQVRKRIEAIADALELEERAGAARVVLFMKLGVKNPVTTAIHKASGGAIPWDDLDAQRAFVQRDLGPGAVALAVPDRDEDDGFELMLRGYQLSYRHIRSFRQSHWSAALCDDAQLAAVTAAPLQSQVRLDPVQVAVVELNDPYLQSAPSRAGWLALRQRLQPRGALDHVSDQSTQGLLLMLVIQNLVALAEEFPVDPVERPTRAPAARGFSHALHVRIREDEDRERLAQLLKLGDRPGERLRQSVAGDDDRPSDSWRLVEDPSQANAEDEPDTEWEFIAEHTDEKGTTFVFGGARAPQAVRRGILVPSDSAGTHKQLRRQYQLWRTLRDDRELLRAITHARDRPGTQQVPLVEGEGFKDLDTSKQDALRVLARGLGLSLVQGPPGVGKTLLVSEFARQITQARRGWRVLFSAQSHSATDNLMAGVQKKLGSETDDAPLIVRARAQDPNRRPTEFDLPQQVRRYAQTLKDSDLVRESPAALQRQVQELASAAQDTHRGTSPARSRLKRAFESLLIRSANLLFSTSNAGAIEQLIAEHAQFDWSIVEEAAKATGNELIGPLLLSRQRVMIGDHRQLPPFNAALLERLFRSPNAIAKLLELAEALGGKHLRNADMRALVRGDASHRLDELCEIAGSHLYFFQSLLERCRGAPVLSFQHRMHPAIARVVSHAFYGDKLDSASTCEARFRAPPVVRSADPQRYPEVPIVWVDMPWDQATRHRQPSESHPGPFNLPEVEAVMRILRNLIVVPQTTPKGMEVPTLAILSPYRAQVRALKSRLRADSSLRHRLEAFRPVGDVYVHTVDSFQGREADVVIVSLVRNNHNRSLRRALGFLADPRRMNVLLSRAQWRLFIVGCERFIRHVSQRKSHDPAADSTDFLQRMFAAVEVEQRAGCAVCVPAERRPRTRRRRRRHR
jgi:hypothetical protein